jgi:dTDP-4-dehydrorhamnose reductase
MWMRKVIVIGAKGQLGTDLVNELSMWRVVGTEREIGFQVIPLSHKEFELRDYAETREKLTDLKPDAVINTAAYHQVDECEDYPEKAFQVNAIALQNLACVCRDLNAVLMHISTDYVFGGDQNRWLPYTEDDPLWPLNVYGISKLAGEYFVRKFCPKHFIVRSSGLYGLAGSSGKGSNFVETMLRLAQEGEPIQVVNDQRLTPTYTLDLARKIRKLIINEHFGIYHIVNAGDCTWYEFAAKIFEYTHLTPRLSPITTEAFGARARRPRYSVLACQSLQKIGLENLRPWQEALRAYLSIRADNHGS